MCYAVDIEDTEELSEDEVSEGDVLNEDNESFEEEYDICAGGVDEIDEIDASSVGTGEWDCEWDCPFFRITTILSRDAFGRIGRSKSYTDAKNDGA